MINHPFKLFIILASSILVNVQPLRLFRITHVRFSWICSSANSHI